MPMERLGCNHSVVDSLSVVMPREGGAPSNPRMSSEYWIARLRGR